MRPNRANSSCLLQLLVGVRYLDDSRGRQVPLPFLCQLLRNGYPVMHHKGPALAAQVYCPEEEVLLMLVHLPRKRGFNNLSPSMHLQPKTLTNRSPCAAMRTVQPPSPPTSPQIPVYIPSISSSPQLILFQPLCTT